MTSPFSSSLPALSTHKRKRSQPPSMPTFSLTANPLSHSPSLLSQFALAGLSEADPAPSSLHPDFPHRGLRRSPPAPTTSATQAEADTDAELDDDEGVPDQAQHTDELESTSGKKKKNKPKADHQTDGGGISAAVTTLTGSIHHFLSQGETAKASRAFGLILQLAPHGKPVDVRRHHLWALGAEILMRQGETPISPSPSSSSPTLQSLGHAPGAKDSEGIKRRRRRQRWGQAVNMPRVRAYYESLTHQYPFDHRRPNVTSALDFWPALVSCELYNIDVERVIALNKLERRRRRHKGDAETGSSSQGETSSEDDPEDDNTRLLKKQEAVRAKALKELRYLIRRMDAVMVDAPYSANPQMLRLRSTAGVFMSDLVRPLVPDEAGPMEAERVEREREDELSKARRCLAKILESGATLSEAELALMEEPTRGGSERGQVISATKEKRKKKKRDRAGVVGDLRGMNSSLPIRTP